MKVIEILEGAAFGITDGLICVLGIIIGSAAATSDAKLVVLAGVIGGVSNSFANSVGVYISQATERGVQKAKVKNGEDVHVHSVNENILNSLASFISAMSLSLIMIVPFLLLPVQNAMITSLLMGIIVLFLFGAYIGKISDENPIVHGLQYGMLGIIGAVLSYIIGSELKGLIGV